MIRKIAAATALSLGALTVGGTAIASAAPSVDLPAFTYQSHLHTLLLGSTQLNTLTHVEDGQLQPVLTKSDFDDDYSVTPATCTSAFAPGQRTAYADYQSTAVAAQFASDGSADKRTRLANQTLVSFTSHEAAGEFLTATQPAWQGCAETTLSIKSGGKNGNRWTLGKPELRRGGAILTLSQTSTKGTCERALAGTDDTVADVMVCAYDGTDPAGQAEAVAAALAGNVHAQ